MTDYATLGAYQPTWRDQLAQWMLGDAPTPERHNFVQGLLGSGGLGSTGASVSDFVPGVGQVLSAQEAAQHGDPKGFAMAMLPMPGGAAESALAKEGEEAAKRGITAYHGSPHSFDKFDLSKIGTGEGAQAYGHGLYFAENEGVARQYRDNLSPATLEYEGADFGNPRWALSDARARILSDMQKIGKPQALQNIKDNIRFNEKYAPDIANLQKSHLEWAEGIDPDKINVNNPGSMYQVRLNAEPHEFLDWDKPLSEQHPQTVEALQQNVPEYPRIKEKSPADLIASGIGGYTAEGVFKDAGIPGVRYLDQGSRGAGGGTHNYVVFDDKIIDIMKQYGIVPIMAGGGLAGIQGNDGRAYTLTPVDHDPFAMESPRRGIAGAPRG